MDHDHVHHPPLHIDLHMQQPALFEAMVRHVFVAVRQHRPARQQRVAMFAVARDGVGAVDRLVALGRQELGLRQIGPVREVMLLPPVQLADLLQADDVGVELFDGVAEVVDLQPLSGPHALHTLVDVVGGDAQRVLKCVHTQTLPQKPRQHQHRLGIG
jgi:hypothetical protein